MASAARGLVRNFSEWSKFVWDNAPPRLERQACATRGALEAGQQRLEHRRQVEVGIHGDHDREGGDDVEGNAVAGLGGHDGI